MALKRKLDNLEGLDETISKLYKKVGDHFILDADDDDDVGPLRRAKDREKAARVEAEQKAADLQTQLDALTGNDARKRGDIDTLEKSWKAKLEAKETELNNIITKLKQNTVGNMLTGAAGTLAAEISSSPALMQRVIKERLSIEFDTDYNPSLRVLDGEGKVSANSLADLKKELVANADYAAILIGSKATGGGAPSGQNGGGLPGGKSAQEMTEQERTALFRSNPAEFHRLFPRKIA